MEILSQELSQILLSVTALFLCRNVVLYCTRLSFYYYLLKAFQHSHRNYVWFVIGWWNITFANMHTAVFKNNMHISFKTGFVGHAYKLHWLLWIQCNCPTMLKLFLLYFSTSCMKHELTVLHST